MSNKNAYDLSKNGGLKKLRDKLINQLSEKECDICSKSAYQPRKLPKHANL